MNLSTKNRLIATSNLSSMSGIVVLLLFFFLITTIIMSGNAIDLSLAENKTVNSKNTTVFINKDLEIFVDMTQVFEPDFEKNLLHVLSKNPTKTIVLKTEVGVPVEKVVWILDIANRNKIKVVLEVSP